jgi:predicted Zn finger-like uncharacterized protein
MRIACPSCSAAYDVPDPQVPPGRVVRCARCGSEWTPAGPVPPSPPPAVEPPPPEPEPEPEPFVRPRPAPVPEPAPRESAMDRLAAHPALPQSKLRLRLAWAASMLLIVLCVAGAIAWRTQVVESWPPSARMYAAFGMHPGKVSAHE